MPQCTQEKLEKQDWNTYNVEMGKIPKIETPPETFLLSLMHRNSKLREDWRLILRATALRDPLDLFSHLNQGTEKHRLLVILKTGDKARHRQAIIGMRRCASSGQQIDNQSSIMIQNDLMNIFSRKNMSLVSNAGLTPSLTSWKPNGREWIDIGSKRTDISTRK